MSQLMTRFSLAFTASVGALALSVPALADEGQHLDVFIASVGGTLTTSGIDHETDRIVAPGLRVFGVEFGEDPLFPFAAFDPGFQSNLTDTSIALNLYAGLGLWNGAGFDAAPVDLFMSYGPYLAGTGSGGSAVFTFEDDLHVHPDFFLDESGGEPAAGIYLASFNVAADGYQSSETFWVVFNLGMSEEDHDAAIEWTEANLVPAPGAISLLGLLMASRQARSRRRD